MNKEKEAKQTTENLENNTNDDSTTNETIVDETKLENPTEETKEQEKTFTEPTLEEKYKELNDKFLRLYSDFDNFRKRTIKERIELSKTASEQLITKILPVIDDLDRAQSSFETATDINAVEDGITLIISKLKNILTQEGLEEMKSVGETFNSDIHEALTMIPAPNEDAKGKVVDEIQKGYLLSGKMIRVAKVVVGN